MPDSIISWGLLIAPPHSSTSDDARTVCVAPPWRKVTPVARDPSSSTRVAKASVATVRLGRLRAGFRYASLVDQRRPLRQVTWYCPAPSWETPLKSSVGFRPALTALSTNAWLSGWV